MKKNILLSLLIMLFLIQCGQKTAQENTLDYDTTSSNTKEQKKTIYTYDSTKVQVRFTAYKLPEEKRVGVEGKFTQFSLTGAHESEKPEAVLNNTQFKIATNSVSTNDKSRDNRIITFFFQKMLNSEYITGSFGEFTDNEVLVTLEMNGQKVIKTFNYEVKEHSLIITGKIDVISNFKAQEALNGITNACKDFHEGKTWPDVDISVVLDL